MRAQWHGYDWIVCVQLGHFELPSQARALAVQSVCMMGYCSRRLLRENGQSFSLCTHTHTIRQGFHDATFPQFSCVRWRRIDHHRSRSGFALRLDDRRVLRSVYRMAKVGIQRGVQTFNWWRWDCKKTRACRRSNRRFSRTNRQMIVWCRKSTLAGGKLGGTRESCLG